jgi:hypothetical protein
MRLIGLSVNEDDDADFIALTQRLIHGVVMARRPRVYCVVRVDNWFGGRWLNFSGKMLGALGVRKTHRVTFPPFVPNRIRSYSLFKLDEDGNDYSAVEKRHPVHRSQTAGDNLHNFVEKSFPDCSFFWFSSNTKANGCGSIMGYIVGKGTQSTWYLEFRKEGSWKRSKAVNITEREIASYLNTCGGHFKGPCPPVIAV